MSEKVILKTVSSAAALSADGITSFFGVYVNFLTDNYFVF